METTTARQAGSCKATTKDGLPCRALRVTDSDYCFMHDPALAEERKEARARGGRARHGRKIGPVGEGEYVEIRDLGDVLRVLASELNAVLSLEKSISRARAVGYLAGIMANIYQASELEQRLAALEAQAGMGR